MRLRDFVRMILTWAFCGFVMLVGIRLIDSYLTLCDEVRDIAERVERIENSGPPPGSADVFNQD